MSRNFLVAVFILSALSIGYVIHFLNRGSQILHAEAETAIQNLQAKRKAISAMTEAGRQRTLTLLTLFHEQDPFVRDQLGMQLSEQAVQFIRAREQIQGLDLTWDQEVALTEAMSQVRASQGVQEQVIDALHSDDRESGERLLFGQVLPNQNANIRILNRILGLIDDESSEVQLRLGRQLRSNQRHILALVVLVVVIGGLLLFQMLRTLRERELLLEGSEAVKSSILDSVLDAIITTSETGVISQFNRGAEALFGHSARQICGKPIQSLLVDGRFSFAERIHEQCAEGNSHRVWGVREEVEVKHRNGRGFNAELTVSDTGIAGGLRYVWIIRDLTRIRQAERELKERERRQGAIIDSLFCFVAICSRDGVLLEASQAWLERSGLQRRDVIGQPMADVWCWSFSAGVQERVREAMGRAEEGEVVRYDSRMRVLGGEIITVDSMFCPLRSPEGNVVELMFAGMDVSQRMREGARLKTLNENLERRLLERSRDLADARTEASQERSLYRSIVETAVDAIVSIDRNGRIVGFNLAAQQLFGYRVDEVCGKNVSMLMPEAIARHHDEYLQHHIQTGETHIIGVGREVEAVRKGGMRFPVWLAVSKVEVANNLTFTGIMRDLSAQKQAEANMRRAMVRAEEASQTKSQFVANMSHELRTPLNAILGFGHLLSQSDLSEADRENLSRILVASRNLLRLVNQVLEFDRIEAGQIDFHVELLSLDRVVEQGLKAVAELARERGVTIQSSGCKDIRVRVDAAALLQVLIDLLSNAVLYNREQDARVWIECSAIEDGWVRLEVRDTGPGLSDEQLEQMFMPFNRLDVAGGAIHGAGLGLSITRYLVNAMQGRLAAERGSEVGLVVRLELRCEAEPDSAVGNRSDGEPRATGAKDSPPQADSTDEMA